MSKFNPTEFQVQKDTPNFPQMEEEIFKYWKDIKAFEQQLEKTKDLPKFTFYDGPPFATGTPHYGHICAGTIKDVITRYASMDGHYVERRFGWDCHGLPIEHAIDKKLGIKNRNSIYEMGIDKYNDECRKIVMTYSEQWRHIVHRLGRWIDFDNDYKTMDRSFMESVWWVFKQIFDKNLVYRGCKIMPYSTKCLTVLSNFEASQNYKNVSDPAIVITFPIKNQQDVSLLAWTTTPWTLPSNLALSVNPKFTYVKIKDLKNNNIYILAKCRLVELYKSGQEFANCEGNVSTTVQKKPKNKKKKNKKKGKNNTEKQDQNQQEKVQEKEFEILEEMKGSDLEGIEYVPLFNYYEEEMKSKGCFKVLCGDHVTSGAGTGIVHTAPAFGEEDYQICRKYDIIKPEDPCVSIDENGEFIERIKEYKGMYIKEADKKIMKDLKEKKRLVKQSQIVHSYPFCWRSDTPLIYMAQNTWFIRVTELKERLLANNLKSRWVPEFAQKQRFQKWLENVNDWCFSRNRFWGNPIPLWVSDDFEEIVCVGSVEELKELTGIKEDIPDLHMDKIQDITIPSKKGKGTLKRIPETFDCWFESGSMPYASKGYPFKLSEQEFQDQFPGEFIGEGIDQCRGWFYTLNVIGTALFDNCPFKNLVVNGIVLAEDGEKMSKSKQNYPDPMLVVKKYGADSIRLYLMNSPLVYGQDLRFKEQGVQKVVKDIFLPWYFLFKLILQEIQRYEKNTQTHFEYDENLFTKESDIKFDNPMDQWILANTQKILKFVRQEFDNYRLSTVLKRKLSYLDQLSNWYVNMNKRRFKGEYGPQDSYLALNILFHCFFQSITLMAPYVPFIVDYFYQQLKLVINKNSKSYQESIHFLRIPKPIDKFNDSELVQAVEIFQKVMSVQRREREFKEVSKKQPLQKLIVHLRNKNIQKRFENLVPILKEMGNYKEIEFGSDFEKYAKFRLLPNFANIKESLPEDEADKLGVLTPLINKLNQEQTAQFLENKEIELSYKYNGKDEKIILDEDKLLIKCQINSKQTNKNIVVQGDHDFVIEINFEVNDDLVQEYLAREITNRIQKTRKNARVKIDDKILIILKFSENAQNLKNAYEKQLQLINSIVKKPVVVCNDNLIAVRLYTEKCNVKNQDFEVEVCCPGLQVVQDELQKLGDVNQLKSMLGAMDVSSLDQTQNVKLKLEDKEIVLEKGKHFNVLIK